MTAFSQRTEQGRRAVVPLPPQWAGGCEICRTPLTVSASVPRGEGRERPRAARADSTIDNGKWTIDNGEWRMKENLVKIKSFAFALRIVKLYQLVTEQRREFVLSKQLLRSGTAIGALVREAEQAESKADFIHKMAIALKEANETEYWIDLLHQSSYIDEVNCVPIRSDLTELLKMLTSIIKTSKASKASR
jgi:four helix bundle protein